MRDIASAVLPFFHKKMANTKPSAIKIAVTARSEITSNPHHNQLYSLFQLLSLSGKFLWSAN